MASSHKPELPPLLTAGMHASSLSDLRKRCVADFPLSATRQAIMTGLEDVVGRLVKAGVPGEIWVDGSFLTKELNPSDVDFVLCSDAEPYNHGTDEQKAVMRWMDEEDLRTTLRCDCHLSLLHPPADFWHPFDREQRAYMQRLFGFSRGGVAKGIAVISLGATA